MPTILIADDHELIREAIKPYLRQLVEDAKLVEAGSYGEVFDRGAKLKEADARVILAMLDLSMPGAADDDAFFGLRKLKQILPNTPVVIFSSTENPATISEALKNGAQGFIPKSARGRSLVNALRLVLAGEIYVPPIMATVAVEPPPAAPAPPMSEELSSRELESLRILVRGMSNKEIARELGLQAVTVKLHLRKAYRKLGATNRVEAVRIAVERHIA